MNVISVRALDNIIPPRRVMVAGAAIRALHAAVTRKEITALAQSKAVCLVFTQELPGCGFYKW